MKLIQSTVWIAIVVISIILETILRTILFLPTVFTLIVLQLLGCKDTINSEAWHEVWYYACPWCFGNLYISKKVSIHLSPFE